MPFSTAKINVWAERNRKKISMYLGGFVFFLLFGDGIGNVLPEPLGSFFHAIAYFCRVILQAFGVLIGIGIVIGIIFLVMRGLKGRE